MLSGIPGHCGGSNKPIWCVCVCVCVCVCMCVCVTFMNFCIYIVLKSLPSGMPKIGFWKIKNFLVNLKFTTNVDIEKYNGQHNTCLIIESKDVSV